MVNFTALAATAKRLIEANGRSVTLYKRDRTAANASEPWRGPATTPDNTATATIAFVPPSGEVKMGSMAIDSGGTLVRALDQIGLAASTSTNLSGEDLREYDALLDGTRLWKIVFVDELKPASTSLIWVLGLKA